MSIKRLFGFSLFVLHANLTFAQIAPGQIPTPALIINARTVVEDVVVTDKDGRAVPGLRKEDFQSSKTASRRLLPSSNRTLRPQE